MRFIERISIVDHDHAEYLFRLWVLATVFGACFWPFGLWLTRILHLRFRVPPIVSFVTAWISIEWCRHCILLGLTGSECPWLNFGYAGVPCLRHLAAYGGTALISAILVLFNAMLAEIFVATGIARRQAISRFLGFILLLGLEIAISKYSADSVELQFGPKVLVCPFPIATTTENLRSESVSRLREHDALFIVFPELAEQEISFIPGSFKTSNRDDKLRVQRITDLASTFGCDVLVGAVRSWNNSPSTWNSVLHVDKDEGVVAFSDKKTLVPFSERYPPWAQIFLPHPRKREYSAMETCQLFFITDRAAKTFCVSTSVCYDCTLETYYRRLASHTSFFVHVGNEPLDPDQTIAQWTREMCVLRAIETGRSFVKCAKDGYSLIIDPFGRIVPTIQEDMGDIFVLQSHIPLWDRHTLYSRLGDWPIPLFYLLTFFCICRSRLTPLHCR